MNRPLRVLVGVTSKSWGGNEKWAAEAATGLARRGHSISVFCSHDPVCGELVSRGLAIHRVNLLGDLNPVGFASLLRLLHSERPDVLLLTKQREYWMGGLSARAAGRPLVVLRMGLRRKLRSDLKRRAAFGGLSNLIIVNSRAVRSTLLESPWIDPSKVEVLLNCVSLEPAREEQGRRALVELGIPGDCPVVCGAGRLTRQKGFDVLIRSFGGVLEEFDSARLLILGEGGQRRALEDMACDAGVADSVVFAGHVSDTRPILSAVDVYVLSSRNEGMANTLLEAMSVGAPIVATDVSGTGEAVTDTVEALIVPPEHTEELARAVVRLLREPELARSLGAAALSRARSQFGEERMLDELEGMLFTALASRRSRGT